MRKKLLKTIALVLVFTHLLMPVSEFGYAAEQKENHEFQEETRVTVLNDEYETVKYENESENYDKEKEHAPKVDFEKKGYKKNEKISLHLDDSEIVNCYYEAEGVELYSENSNQMEFEIEATEEFGCIDIYADYGDDTVVKTSVYTYTDDESVYLSDISMDQAWYDCMEQKFESGEITREDWDKEYSELSQTFCEVDIETIESDETDDKELLSEITSYETATVASTSTTRVTGRIRWELEDGTKLPMKRTKIELRDKDVVGSELISAAYTDDDGCFSFTFVDSSMFENGGKDLFIRWFNESETFEVVQSLDNLYNYYESQVEENVSPGDTRSFNYYVPYNDTNNITKATFVQQGMIIGQEFAQAMGLNTDGYIHVIYPIFENQAFCIGACGCYVAGIASNYFNNVDMLLHEYGHYVQNELGVYGSDLMEMLLNNPNHFIDTDHFEDKNDKEYAMELTWSEAWATVFSMIAQDYYVDKYSALPGYADGMVYGVTYENYAPKAQSGEAQENAVTAFLWDLYDGYNSSESFDQVSWSHQFWWKYTTQAGMYTLSDFANYIDTKFPSIRGNVGAIMAAYQISAGNLYIKNASSVSASTAPILSWRVNGSTKNANNAYRIAFFNSYGTKIYQTDLITCDQDYSSYITYSVPSTIWSKVVGTYDGSFIINIAVYSYNTRDSLTSGPYFSKYAPVTINKTKSITLGSYDRYKESIVKIATEGYVDYIITPQTSGYRIFQTFGTLDTVLEIYNSSGTLLARQDDSGYKTNSLIYYYLSVGSTYRIRVKCYGSYMRGETKLVIVPATGVLASGVTTISSYESIKNVSGYTGYTWGTYAQLNCARVITFTPPSSGNYTFEITSDFDTYLYVIHPQSTSYISYGVNYNDDSGEGLNPKLTINLTAGVPYMIVYSGYNLSNSAHTGNLTLKITKN